MEAKKYHLEPTTAIPNSPFPLLHYSGLFCAGDGPIGGKFYDLLSSNGWAAQWIYRYGQTQPSHYHTSIHECMVVLTGSAMIRFGVADTVDDLQENTYGDGKEDGGLELHAQAGDVFVIPAGVAHKTFATKPEAEFKLLTPGDGHSLPSDIRAQLDEIELSGFTMMGCYPRGCGSWDFAVGGEGAATYSRAWAVPPPERDPIVGNSEDGLCKLWVKPPLWPPVERGVLSDGI
jgi:uncharacterized protein YjlB